MIGVPDEHSQGPNGRNSVVPSRTAESKIGRAQWLTLTAALLGWMFDGLEMGIFPVAGRPALRDMLQTADGAVVSEAQISGWMSVAIAVFLIGAAVGGVLFGWLGDRVGACGR